MFFRTDLALESSECLTAEESAEAEGIEINEHTAGSVTVTEITVRKGRGEKVLGKPAGKYITVQLPPLTDSAFSPDERYKAISSGLRKLLPEKGTVLVAGIGNRDITPDALGPRTADKVIATRHVAGELERSAGFTALRPTAVFHTAVLGQTGIETAELIRSVCRSVDPCAVIAIDALASRRLSRLGCTVQMSDAGIAPGAGVGNDRPRIDREWLGVPVIAVGIPTVVDADTLARDVLYEQPSVSGKEDTGAGGGREREEYIGGKGVHGMIVTPREIDLLIDRASRLLALAVNHALHPSLDPAELMGMC